MNPPNQPAATLDKAVSTRAGQLFHEHLQSTIRHADRLFAWLMVCQWFFAMALVIWISPLSWSGANSQMHPHVWAALLLGGLVTIFPVALAWQQPGRPLTRHVVAVG